MPNNKTHGRSKAGVQLTDEVLERMAEEAEDGLDITKLRRRPGRPAMGSGPSGLASSAPRPRTPPSPRRASLQRQHHRVRHRSRGAPPLPQGQLSAWPLIAG